MVKDKDSERLHIVLRGASGGLHQTALMTAVFRDWSYPTLQYSFCGFRCCKPFLAKKQIKRWKDETEGGLFDG